MTAHLYIARIVDWTTPVYQKTCRSITAAKDQAREWFRKEAYRNDCSFMIVWETGDGRDRERWCIETRTSMYYRNRLRNWSTPSRMTTTPNALVYAIELANA